MKSPLWKPGDYTVDDWNHKRLVCDVVGDAYFYVFVNNNTDKPFQSAATFAMFEYITRMYTDIFRELEQQQFGDKRD